MLITDPTLLNKPAIAMLVALVLVIWLENAKKQICSATGWFLLAAYPVLLMAMFCYERRSVTKLCLVDLIAWAAKLTALPTKNRL
ncbi:hypothetical protein IQ269_06315 [Tychonema sp. LEGE 07199]|uniref:hypothetical protein n=1 Tax=unclassified Tychonema TaxID=2642144 RepID=UPI00187F9F09|nr:MULTISPECIES: hypothetical protein [unclassified Tychonema]MBE9120433.1 hypothetical protein [Tychonema sp. LEGE 07199]MBE9131726.1 hypothetical protein [Tychonema sp. LEGE 07196]